MNRRLSKIAKTAFVAVAMALVASVSLPACSSSSSDGDDNTGAAVSKKEDKKKDGKAPSINIRYIDGDSVSARYNLAKNFQEQYLRTVSKMQQAEQSKAAEIQKFGSQIEQKMKNNGYLTEESYNADMMKYQKMQQDAQNYLGSLQRNAEQELMRQQQELNDSIEAYIKDYNRVKGYDAILFKAAGVYFDPALDITDEVVEGLNARYANSKTEK